MDIKLDRTNDICVPSFTFEDIAIFLRGYEIVDSDENILKVVMQLKKYYDPEYGVNWDVIRTTIDVLEQDGQFK